MNTSDIRPDEAWEKLADAAEEDRETKMRARYLELAALSEEERCKRLEAMAQAEYALPDDKLRSFTASRLRVWLGMDLEPVRMVASSYDTIMRRMPGTIAMRRVGIVQTLAREFSTGDQGRLRALVPGVFGERPVTPSVAAGSPPSQAATAPKKKAWWAFWQRS